MFYIPIENYPKLEKKFNKIKSKGGILNLNKYDPIVLAVQDNGTAWPEVQKGSPAWEQCPKHKFIPIEVDGKYEIPGWEFVASIEHTPNGNLIRNITDEKIPERYLSSTPECEHCHKSRDRKDTYLVKNTETGEFKQIGRSCLRDYTGGLDANVAAQIAEWVVGGSEDIGDDLVVSSEDTIYFWPEKFKKIAYKYVEANGYSKDPDYINKLVDVYVEGKPLATDQEIEDVNNWVLNLDTKSNDYYRNAFLAWSLDDYEYRHLRLVASLINSYFKDREKQKQSQAASKYVGEVGEKIVLKVASSRILYWKSFYHGRYKEETPVFKIVGTDGNIYIWATNTEFKDGDTIVATVKSHSEYSGEKQTVITRGKINNTESLNQLFLDEE